MNVEEIRDHCIAKKAVSEGFPFDSDTLVFKVGGKMFLLVSISSKPLQFNIKCDPDKVGELREKYSFVTPGFHMNKSHWNTITCDREVPKKLVFGWIDDSYRLVASGLPKRLKQELGI